MFHVLFCQGQSSVSGTYSVQSYYVPEEYGINVKEMLKTPHEFNGNQLEYLRKTFYDNIPNIRSVLPDGKERKMKSYYFMKNYGLTEAGYGYVSELLKFSHPASKEIRDMMAENRKNTIEVKSRYEKELENQQMSANLIIITQRLIVTL